MKKFLLVIIAIVGISSGAVFGYRLTHADAMHETKTQVLSTENQQKEDKPTEYPQEVVNAQPGIPVNISIPKINVNTTIESVGMDSKGRMDVPKDADNTAWFRLGYRPGTNGSAVIDGHYDKASGAPAVFWDLDKLEDGDQIIVTDDAGNKWTFVVNRTTKYPYDQFPLKEVFGASDVPKLNLITCHGEWNDNTKNYAERMVIYSTLQSEK